MSKCHIVGNLKHWLIYGYNVCPMSFSHYLFFFFLCLGDIWNVVFLLLSPILLTRELLVGLPTGLPACEFSFPLKRCCCPTFSVEACFCSSYQKNPYQQFQCQLFQSNYPLSHLCPLHSCPSVLWKIITDYILCVLIAGNHSRQVHLGNLS